MIIEFLGTGGSGKTTLEPLLADALGIPYLPGKKRHTWDGEPLTSWGVWISRVRDVVSNPKLATAALATRGSLGDRTRLALDIVRRDGLARRSHELGSAVVGSGGLHRLCVAAARKRIDVSGLARHITPANVYVFLLIEADEASRRLSDRLGDRDRDLSEHDEETRAYVAIARDLTTRLGKDLIEVEALGPPQPLADEISALVRSRWEDAPPSQQGSGDAVLNDQPPGPDRWVGDTPIS